LKIAVYGAGGLGCYFGGRLARAGADVHLIARGPHLAALRTGGLTVRGPAGEFHVEMAATDDAAEIGPSDVVLFCVKSFDTATAAARLAPLLGPDTAVVSLQNGIDNEDKIAAAVGREHVLGGAAYVFATIAEPGVVQATGPGRVVFGELDGRASERGERLLAACREAEIPAELRPDIGVTLWDKFAFICAQAGMTACVRLPIGEIRAAEPSRTMFRRILEEVVAVAGAEGVLLPPETVARLLAFADELDPAAFSSLHYDLEHGKRMEVEALHGTVVRLARQHGLRAPMCEAVYAILAPWARRNAT
jgi:2-dehydropantoate 2-reductase